MGCTNNDPVKVGIFNMREKEMQIRPGWVDLPFYATPGSSGVDLKAYIPEGGHIFIEALQRAVIGTGLFVELPKGYELQIRSKSGLAANHGIMVLNSPGTIDEDYRGEIGVILYNTDRDFKIKIKHDMKIAQAVLARVPKLEWQPVKTKEELSQTIRQEGGFGSTGQ